MPIPEIVFEGERDQWPYLVITRLYGRLGSEVWPHLPEDQKERVLFQIGATSPTCSASRWAISREIEPRWDAVHPEADRRMLGQA